MRAFWKTPPSGGCAAWSAAASIGLKTPTTGCTLRMAVRKASALREDKSFAPLP